MYWNCNLWRIDWQKFGKESYFNFEKEPITKYKCERISDEQKFLEESRRALAQNQPAVAGQLFLSFSSALITAASPICKVVSATQINFQETVKGFK